MEEFAYRIWDECESKWIEDDYVIDCHGVIYHIDRCELEEPITPREHLNVCVLTGLKDKNGKVICEDDLVKDCWGNIHKVVYQNARWYCPTVKKISSQWPAQYLHCTYMEWEIIGNIHANPELLGVAP